MLLASELLELLEKRYPIVAQTKERTSFEQGKEVAIQQIISEIRSEIEHATDTK